ncbi:MAG: helix-hairpin-helix domain-containing protein [Campylobacteraceae bacterium]|nr:helix-hairpin-helix domain-containing protein [Campylobacteraceae bacterium]
MKKFMLILLLGMSLLFGSMDINTASKTELMQIKGIGLVKAEKILEFRKNNKIEDINELQKIKGFGPALIANIKKSLEK